MNARRFADLPARRVATCLGALLAALGAATAAAQTALTAAEFAALRQAQRDLTTDIAPSAAPIPVENDLGVLALAEPLPDGGGIAGPGVDLYTGLQPGGPPNGFWSFGNVPHNVLDDGRTGTPGGGHVNAYEFAFGLHGDYAGHQIRPAIALAFYNAPFAPVASASNPVVEPPAPVHSVIWRFNAITMPGFGEFSVRSPLLDLTLTGADFGLDETWYVEIVPLEWFFDGSNFIYSVDADCHTLFTGPTAVTFGSNIDTFWSDEFVRDNTDAIVYSNRDGFYQNPAERDSGGHTPRLAQAPIRLVGEPCNPTGVLKLTISGAGSPCIGYNQPITVVLSQSCLPQLVRGYQAFLQHNPGVLTFVGGVYIVPAPYGLPIIVPITSVGGDINLAAGINDLAGQPPTSNSADLAILSFVTGPGSGPAAVVFRPNSPPTRFSDLVGGPVNPATIDSSTIFVDGAAPSITCPPDISVDADAGSCAALVNPGTPTVVDNVDPAPVVSGTRSDSLPLTDPYPTGVTTITWTATDCAGNSASCVQTITVSAFNAINVTVQLSPTIVAGPITRCIQFRVWNCGNNSSLLFNEAVTFTGGLGSATLLVPCAAGPYACITARDPLHTLRRTAPLGILGPSYSASFTGADTLIGGNLNGDNVIDILDFGVFTSEYAQNYGSGSTTCATPPPHADINGDGIVFTQDFTFIQINFLLSNEPNCCGQPGFADDGAARPRTRVSVAELFARGLGHLAAGDLNHDGWLDPADIAAFLGGQRPAAVRPGKPAAQQPSDNADAGD